MQITKQEIEELGWRWITDRNSGYDYFQKERTDIIERYIEGSYIIKKPIDDNFQGSMSIKATSLIGNDCYVYIGKVPSKEDFIKIIDHVCPFLVN